MLTLGILLAIATPLSELLYTKDYWQPGFVFGTQFGIEDILFGIEAGGIGAVVYEEVFRRGFLNRHYPRHGWFLLLIPVIVFAGIFILQRYFGVNSVVGTYITFLIVAGVILVLRRDLLREAVISGILLTLLALPVYLIWQTIYPGLFAKFWVLQNLSGVTLFGIPIEELLIYPPLGLILGTLYEFITGFGDRRLPVYSKRRKR